MPQIIQDPDTLAKLLQEPQRVRDAIALLNGLAQIQVILQPVGSARPLASGNRSIVGEPPNLVLPLPIAMQTAIADSTATAASVSAQLNLLLAALRLTKLLPS